MNTREAGEATVMAAIIPDSLNRTTGCGCRITGPAHPDLADPYSYPWISLLRLLAHTRECSLYAEGRHWRPSVSGLGLLRPSVQVGGSLSIASTCGHGS